MQHVFISYSRKDEDRVNRVVRRLTGEQVPTWIDQTGIPVSLAWDREISKAITASTIFVALVSEAWNASEHCASELRRAEAELKPVLRIAVGPGFDAEQAAAQVADAYRQTLAVEGVRAEFSVWAAEWAQAGRPRKRLAPPRLVRDLERLGRVPLTPDTRELLDASRRRNRRRRVLGVIGSVTTAALVISPTVIDKVRKDADTDVNKQTSALVEHFSRYDTAQFDIYAGLTRAADRLTSGDDNYLDVDDLMSVLDVAVPDQIAPLTGRHPLALAPGGPDQADLTVLGADGRIGSPADPAGTPPLRPTRTAVTAAGDASGRDVVLAGASFTVGRLAGRPVSSATCSGSLSAVSSEVLAVANRHRLCIWTGHGESSIVSASSVTALAVSGDVTLVGHADGSVTSVTAGTSRTILPAAAAAPAVAVAALSVSADRTSLAVARSQTAAIDLVALPSGQLEHRVVVASPPSAVAFAPDGRVLAAVTGTEVQIVDVVAGAVQQALRGSATAVRSVAWTPDGAKVWALDAQGRALRWSWRSGAVHYDDASSWITDGVGLRGNGFAAVTRSGQLLVDRGGHVTQSRTAANPTADLAASPDGSTVVLVDASGLVLHDLASGSETVLHVPGCQLQDAAFSRDGRSLYLACGSNGVLRIDRVTGAVTARLASPTGSTGPLLPITVVVAADGSPVVGGLHGDVVEADAGLTRSTYVVHGAQYGCYQPRRALAITPDGNTVVDVGDGGTAIGCVTVARRRGGTWHADVVEFSQSNSTQARALTIDPTGRIAAIGLGDGQVVTITLDDLNPGWAWEDLTGAVRGLSFTADGHLLAATRDGLIESLPGCPGCESRTQLVQVARDRVALGRKYGLTR